MPRICWLVLFLIGPAAGALAATWYVGPDGVGADAPGQGRAQTNPLATVSYAINQASSGDEVYLLTGRHTQTGTLYVAREIALTGAGRTNATLFFPTNFTSSLGVSALVLMASNITVQSLTVERRNFLAYGAVIQVPDIWPDCQALYDHILIRDVDVVGGAGAFILHPKNITIENCAIYGMDAADSPTALAFDLPGFNGQVNIRGNYIHGLLAGALGGLRVRRVFQIEPHTGPERSAGILNIESNLIFNVREPFLWNHWTNPTGDPVRIRFNHNTLSVTEKTPFTFWAQGTGTGGLEYLKFTGVEVRDNIFANIYASALARADYQAGSYNTNWAFARNFPVGGFSLRNNLLYVDPATALADALYWPLATDPGWFGGAEFDTNGQFADLRFDYTTNLSPFVYAGLWNRNCALSPTAPAGLRGYGAATDGQNIGAWQMHRAEIRRNPDVELTWNSTTGLNYQAQWTADLASGAWRDLGAPVPGDGRRLFVPAATGRFQRVLIVP